jgi:hypothetical protein
MTIFIPLLFICINGHCEFMQSTGYFQAEQQCLADLDLQKQRMQDLLKQAGQGKIEILQGTCVDLDVIIINNKKVQHGKSN